MQLKLNLFAEQLFSLGSSLGFRVTGAKNVEAVQTWIASLDSLPESVTELIKYCDLNPHPVADALAVYFAELTKNAATTTTLSAILTSNLKGGE
jgi:hypothetical protein